MLLKIIKTDSTFNRVDKTHQSNWKGKCISCNRWLYFEPDGMPISNATVEHIEPQNHGGGENLRNLAIACANCNHEKGRRHDRLSYGDESRLRIVLKLIDKRNARWRDGS